ncbi:hypothetical protein KC365_g71 [Hortaea werneckii]|nr:hypothetical protein KC365_g71 [Hortaea werneckii]
MVVGSSISRSTPSSLCLRSISLNGAYCEPFMMYCSHDDMCDSRVLIQPDGYLVHPVSLVLVVDSCWKVVASSLYLCHMYKVAVQRKQLEARLRHIGCIPSWRAQQKRHHDRSGQSATEAHFLITESLYNLEDIVLTRGRLKHR